QYTNILLKIKVFYAPSSKTGWNRHSPHALGNMAILDDVHALSFFPTPSEKSRPLIQLSYKLSRRWQNQALAGRYV
ncbi:hypothetical protein KJ068_23910, partial [bacterium]|nr:hypothetical protein [bacterium]